MAEKNDNPYETGDLRRRAEIKAETNLYSR
jgi:hypothetical protein